MDHQFQPRQINAARRHIGGDADPGAAIAQGLQGMGAFLLRQFPRQGHHLKAAIAHPRQQMVHIHPGLAEDNGGFRFVKPQQVEDRMFAVARRHRQGAVFDVDMLARLTLRLDAQRIALELLGEGGNFLWHRGRKHQRAALGGRGLQDELQILAEAQIEHLIRLVQHHGAQPGQVERAALDMVAQAARRADDDMRAAVQRPLFGAVIHAADAGGDLGGSAFVKPVQLPRHLQRQFAGGGDDQCQRAVGIQKLIGTAQEFIGDGDAEGHGLAGTGLRRDQQVAPGDLLPQHGGLNRRQAVKALGRQGRSQRRGDCKIGHVISQSGVRLAPVKSHRRGTSLPLRRGLLARSAPEFLGRAAGHTGGAADCIGI